MNSITIGVSELSSLKVPLTDQEWDEKRIERSKHEENIDRFKAAVEAQKAKLKHEFGVSKSESDLKVLRKQLAEGHKEIEMLTTQNVDAERLVMCIYAAKAEHGYEIGELIMERPLTMSERTELGFFGIANTRPVF